MNTYNLECILNFFVTHRENCDNFHLVFYVLIETTLQLQCNR